MTAIDEPKTDASQGGVDLPRTERPDAPAYLQKYYERTSRGGKSLEAEDRSSTDEGPLYLRRFRERKEESALSSDIASYEGQSINTNRAWAEVTRTREIIPERREHAAQVTTDVYFVRHGETQGYSTESGLTPLGSWQAHRRGQELARRVLNGHKVIMGCADSNRSRQTAEHLRRGLLDQVQLFGREAEVSEITSFEEFRNFQVSTPEGMRDVTQAFRQYHKEMEKYERIGQGDRPLWLVEVDRFWGIQQGGGDPITHWLTMPMLSFEPPVACVRRFWAGLLRVHSETPGNSIVIATHSGPIRAFATWAMGYDPGEPFNTEAVRVRLIEGGKSALVLYRNRVQEVTIPDLDQLPDWWAGLPNNAVPLTVREDRERA
jgi:broad specificity phosphatase PhoE